MKDKFCYLTRKGEVFISTTGNRYSEGCNSSKVLVKSTLVDTGATVYGAWIYSGSLIYVHSAGVNYEVRSSDLAGGNVQLLVT